MSDQNHKQKRKPNASIFKIFFAVSIISVLLFGGMTFYSWPRFSKNRAENMEQNINKISVGMTKQQMKDLFGKPDDYTPKLPFFGYDNGVERASYWLYLYLDDDFSHQIEFDPTTGLVTKSEKVSTGIGL
jgi:hypothetical protein